ncbi:MAG: hypothetical protein V1794_00980, partial [Candidatus Glassbacteria bacterium]
LIFLALVNIALNSIYGKRIYKHFTGLSFLNVMLGVGISIAELGVANGPKALDAIRKSRNLLIQMKKKIGWLVMDKSRLGDLADIFVEYLNMICLFDLVAFIRSIDSLEKHRPDLAEAYAAVASLDFGISMASYLSSLPCYCLPVYDQNRLIEFEEVYHPLLVDPVANSFSLAGKSALITGSNMAGKTTFIKTVGVNVLLGQTLNFCLAQKAVFPRLPVKSSISREENLDEGKSYYMVEVEKLLEFIRASRPGRNILFLIDEIYRGTNTVERIASATAVLNYIGKDNTVLVTTHDIELQDLLDKNFVMFHFSEQVEGERYFFDYKIKKGPSRSRNAIKLLELSGYPVQIISEASTIAQKLENNNMR